MKKIILVAALLSAAVCLPAQNKGGNKMGESIFLYGKKHVRNH